MLPGVKLLVRRVKKQTILLLCSFMVLVAGIMPLAAQVGAGSLSGTVLDGSGAVVPGTRALLHNDSTGANRSSTSGNSGGFSFAAVIPGDYTLTLTRDGFDTYKRTGIHLNAGDALTLDKLQLTVGATSDTVTVESTVAGLPMDSGQLSSTITATDLDRLSVVGRDATELQRILPGFAIRNTNSTNVAPDFTQVQIGQPTPYSSNGAPVAGITLKLDGAILTNPGNFGSSLQNINDSFVSEVQVQTSNFGADQSNGPVIIQGVTKAGTSHYHGSLYTFARASQLNANDSLAKYNGESRPADRYIYPGGTFSGPVPGLKKLTFFAGAEYDAQRNIYAYSDINQAIIHALVPTAALRAGDFSTAAIKNYLGPVYTNPTYKNIAFQPTFGIDGTALPTGNIAPYLDPGAKALVNAVLPMPTMATNAAGYNYTAQNLVNNNVSTFTGRGDYAINARNTFFVRYTYEKQGQGQPQVPYYSPNLSNPQFGDVNTPGGGFINAIHVQSGAANYVSVITPTLTNELYATLIYSSQVFTPKSQAALQSSTIGYPYQGAYANGSTAYPQLQDYGPDGLPIAIQPDTTSGGPFLKVLVPNFGDNLTKVWGQHTVKIGVFVQEDRQNSAITNSEANGAIFDYYYPGAGSVFHSYKGQYPDHSPAFDPTNQYESGNPLANFEEGIIQDFQQQNYLPRTNLYFWTVDGYAQDSWRLRPNFVMNYGLRITHMGPWDDAHGIGAAVFRPDLYASGGGATSVGLPGFTWHALDGTTPTSGSPAPPVYYEPRVGFSWDLLKTGKTVLRGGLGEYRIHDSVGDVQTAFSNAQGLRTAILYGFGSATLSGVSSVAQNPLTFGGVNTAAFGLSTTDNQEPVTNNYSLSLAQQLPGKSGIVQVSYVGNNTNSLLNNGTTQPITLNNINALPIGTLYTAGSAARLNAVTPGTCNPGGCTPAQVATLPSTGNPAILNATTGAVITPGSAGIQVLRPYPDYTTLNVPLHNTFANYNALQVEYIKQTGNLTLNLNYTFSKALGILGSAADFNFTAGVDPINLYNNYGVMNFDRSQVFNASYSYSFGRVVKSRLAGGIANGWLVSGITNIQTGPDLQTGVSASPNFNLTGTVGPAGNTLPVNNQVILGTTDISLQPTVTCDLKSGRAAHQYINANCLGLPAVGTNGQYQLPYLHGPLFFTTDLTAEKGFGLGHEREIRFRIAGFNFINHPLNSFGTGDANQINLNLSSAVQNFSTAAASPTTTFGFAPQTVGRRVLEVSARFNF